METAGIEPAEGNARSFGEWQRCPICNGDGHVWRPWGQEACPTCDGKRIIEKPLIEPLCPIERIERAKQVRRERGGRPGYEGFSPMDRFGGNPMRDASEGWMSEGGRVPAVALASFTLWRDADGCFAVTWESGVTLDHPTVRSALEEVAHAFRDFEGRAG